MSRKIYREGQRFGKLIAIKYVKSKKYLCKCDCGKEKIIYTSHLVNGTCKSCGCLRLITRDNYTDDLKKRILNSIKINDNNCWIWQKSKNKNGYGIIGCRYKIFLVHRLSWTLFKGQFDNEILVCHKCDNPSCCNPEHLFLGSDRDNVLDSINKGRFTRKYHNSFKITPEHVKEIRKLSEKGMNNVEISKKFNVSREHIGSIIRKKCWKNVV